MIGMETRRSQTKPKAPVAKNKDLSPSKVLAIVANWNSSSPVKASPKRKRALDERLSASVPTSKRKKAAVRKDYLSTSSDDDDDIPSFKAKPFYSSTKRTRYLSPFERKEQLDRLIDAGVDPKTLNKSFDELKRDKSVNRPHSQAVSESKVREFNGIKTVKSVSRKFPQQTVQKRTLPFSKSAKSPAQKTHMQPSSNHVGGTSGEITVTLCEKSPQSAPERRSSPRKQTNGMSGGLSKGQGTSPQKQPSGRQDTGQGSRTPKKGQGSSCTPTQQWRRSSPRKSSLNKSAKKGIQMYMRNLKSGQKKGGKKPEGSKAKVQGKGKAHPANNTKTKAPLPATTQSKKATPQKAKTATPSKTRTRTPKKTPNKTPTKSSTTDSGASSARGLDFGKSTVTGQDVSVLDKSFDDTTKSGNDSHNSSSSNEFADYLVFHDEDFQEGNDVGRETEDFVQNLLMEIDEDLKAAEKAVKQSPRKRKMKTEEESVSASPGSKSTPNRKRLSSTPRSSKKSTQPKLDDWLTQIEGSPVRKKSVVQRSGVKEGSAAMTPESSDTSSPKAKADSTPDKPLKLYPLFTPPTSPHGQANSTPMSRKKEGMMGRVSTPKGAKRSPLLKTLKSKNDNLEQMTLDLGQKRFGAVTCSTCGTVYTAAHPEDEADHAKFHKKYLSGIKFPGWKQEEVIEEYHDGRVIVVTHDAPRYAEKKVEEIKELVDRELGFLQSSTTASKDLCKTYLFVTVDKKVGGCLITEQITQGYRVIVDKSTKDGNVQDSQKAWCCETESEPALCGVSRIWVPVANRRRGIASRMLDCARKNFMFGTVLSPDDIAFSDPTPDGKIFATKYAGTPRFLVYKYH